MWTRSKRYTISDSTPLYRDAISRFPICCLDNLTDQASLQLTSEVFPYLFSRTREDLVIFFSFSNGDTRAVTVHFKACDIQAILKKFRLWQVKAKKATTAIWWLRIDWINSSRITTLKKCVEEIQDTKRNYFRYGLCLDTDYTYPFLEQELNANAVLNIGSDVPNGGLNHRNLRRYGLNRFGKKWKIPTDNETEVILFTTQAVLVQPEQHLQFLHGFCGGIEGRNTGIRLVPRLTQRYVSNLVRDSSEYLARQVTESGRFIYGVHPSFNREIQTYNSLRHASTTYSMLEAVELTNDSILWAAISRSIEYLQANLIKPYQLSSGTMAAFLCDQNNEIKLGGNAVSILALVKYTEITGDPRFISLLEQLAEGICFMQDQESGRYNHILDSSDLSLKNKFRIIYYDGEAAFSLIRLYGLTQNEKWLASVVKAFDYFIKNEHWMSHDHWLSYCVNEITKYLPERKYFEFGIRNVADHLDFVLNRITTYPTLLELMMAARKMLDRLSDHSQHNDLLLLIDLDKFDRALQERARYLLNGFFWPEIAMFFQDPRSIVGSFFIRHHSFRVRIDDVEHYLSGFIAYLNYFFSGMDMTWQQASGDGYYRDTSSLSVLFLNVDLGEHLTGIEHASLTRAKLFHRELGITPLIVTYKYQPFLQLFAQTHIDSKGCFDDVSVIGLYDYKQGFVNQRLSRSACPVISASFDPEFSDLLAEIVPGFRDVRYRDASGRLFAYKVYSKSNGKLTHINYFRNGVKIAADIFHASGLRSSHRIYFANTTQIACEIFYDPKAIPLFFRIFEDADRRDKTFAWPASGFYLATSSVCPPSPVGRVDQPIDPRLVPVGLDALTPLFASCEFLGDESDFITLALRELISTLSSPQLLLLCDKNKFFLEPAIKVREYFKDQTSDAKIHLISMIHSTHFKGDTPTSGIKSHYKALLEKSNTADCIITLTHAQADNLIQHFPSKCFNVIPHTYIPPVAFESRPQVSALRSGSIRIVYVARLSPEKDHIMAVDIFSKLLQHLPRATLHFHGEGMERSSIATYIAKQGLERSVFLEGYCKDVSAVYHSATCSILTSKMEGFSLSVLESMAYGCPVVSFDINYGPSEIISHGETGFLVPYGDVNQFADYLQLISTDPGLAAKLGRQAVEQFQARFSPHIIGSLWSDTITRVLEQ
jgi:hypothetical protein